MKQQGNLLCPNANTKDIAEWPASMTSFTAKICSFEIDKLFDNQLFVFIVLIHLWCVNWSEYKISVVREFNSSRFRVAIPIWLILMKVKSKATKQVISLKKFLELWCKSMFIGVVLGCLQRWDVLGAWVFSRSNNDRFAVSILTEHRH